LIFIFQQHDKKNHQRIYKTDLISWAFQKFTSLDPVLLNKTKIKFWALPFYIDRMLLGRTKELQVRQDIIIFQQFTLYRTLTLSILSDFNSGPRPTAINLMFENP